MTPQFEWNAGKAARNIEKHGVSFDEASTIFDDPMLITVIDDEHSNGEERYITIGLSSNARLLLIAHTDRNGRIRIISARQATKAEARFYSEAR